MSCDSSLPIRSSLLQDPQAWSLVLQWAEDKISYPHLTESLARLGNRYILAEWKGLFDKIFTFSDPGEDIEDSDRIPLAVNAVKTTMTFHGVSQPGLAAQTDAVTHDRKGKRKAVNNPRSSRPKKRISSAVVNRFIDLEADVGGEDKSSEDEEDSDGFLAPDADADDSGITQRHGGMPPSRAHPESQNAGPSTYHRAINNITRRFLPLSSMDNLSDDEYDRRYNKFYGIQSSDMDQEIEEEEDENMKVLDAPGIWGAIQEWMFGSMNYPTLLELIAFQYDHDPRIQYWEDFLSRLTFIDDLKERESLFLSISLAEHVSRISLYRVQDQVDLPSTSNQSVPEQSQPEAQDVPRMWAVNIVPQSSVDYVMLAWKNASIEALAHKILPGRVTVHASYPNLFLRAVPSSHYGCIRSWSLIPFEDRICQTPIQRPTPLVPAWYSVSKRGLYKGDIGYGIFFDGSSNELHLLVAPRKLQLKSRPDGLGRDHNGRRLFSPEVHRGVSRSLYRGLPMYEHLDKVFVSGLLLMKLKPNQFERVTSPSPHQIALHVASLIDPPFMKISQRKFNQMLWKTDDRIKFSDSTYGERRATLVRIDLNTQFAVVRLPEGHEHELALHSLTRVFSVGDLVRVICDPCSDPGNIYHKYMGRSGIVCAVDPLVDDITVTDSVNSEFRVPGFLLESYISDQGVYAPFSSLTPESITVEDTVQVGDMVDVRDGPHRGRRGHVTEVHQLPGTLKFVSSEENHHGQHFVVPISATSFTPDYRVSKYTAERGFDVRPGEDVIVMRGDHRGKKGTVSRVRLEEKLLDISCHLQPNDVLTLPINHCAHAYAVRDRDENQQYLHKEVLIIAGVNKGWRGTLVSCGWRTCMVARTGGILEIYNKNAVVVRGVASTLAGRHLTPLQVLQVCNAFERAVVRDAPPERARTPTPEPQSKATGSTPPDAWTIDENDHTLLHDSRPQLSVHEFMCHPSILKSLETYCAVFQISFGWRDGYEGRLAKTEIPSPFTGVSGLVRTGHLACRLTARTKGAKLLRESIPETFLQPYHPMKKNTLCMVIKSTEGGQPIGSVLSVTKASLKEQRVTVRHLDGSPAKENTIAFDRVILVEVPESL